MAAANAVVVATKMVGIPIFDQEYDQLDSDELFCVREKIVQSHGGTAQNLKLYRNKVEPTTILRDMRVRLKDLHPTAPDPSAPDRRRLVIYYDFTPDENSCPILNVH